MSRVYRKFGQCTADRALELYERGLTPVTIGRIVIAAQRDITTTDDGCERRGASRGID